MTEWYRCKKCGRFKAEFCKNCVPKSKYRCHKCKKRNRCKIRRPEKAHYGDWEARTMCEWFEKDERWRQ